MLLCYRFGVAVLVGLGLFSSPSAGREPAYLTSATCAECHADAYAAWTDSHHGWAWRPARSENVLGDFGGTTFTHRGVRSRFFQKDGRFFVETGGPDGRPVTWPIHSTVGVTPLQQYLVEQDDGRLQALDIAWDTERRRWYHLYPEQSQENDPGLHWTGPYKNWNSRCVSCHVTGFAKGYEPQTNRYDSTWAEMGVGCESCHGPGEAHVAWARQSVDSAETSRSTAAFDGVDDLGLTLRLKGGDRQAELQVCAGCHSRRESLGADSPPPGEPFTDHFRLSLLREGLYHADGQVQDEVYVYGSFLQSKMHARGVSCSDCHSPHSGRLVAEGNGVCTQCHNPQGRTDFPTLKASRYDAPEHHHHAMDGEAAQCVSCHMPEQTYMGVDPRRDHSFRVPRPDLTVQLETPNACNNCHGTQSPQWAQQKVETWYPKGYHLRPHFGQILHAGRHALDTEAAEDLLTLAIDSAEPAIVRASAIELLAPVVTPQIAGTALPLLEDPDADVRAAALGLLQSAPAAARTRYAGPLLEDPTRLVRITAAQRVMDVATDALSEADRAVVDAALDEYRNSLAAQADFPEVQLNVARVALRLGQRRTARQALGTALNLDPKLPEGWLRLAQMEVGTQRFEAARAILQRATAEVPQSGVLHQLHGRVLAQLGDAETAAQAFEQATTTLPDAMDVRLEYVSLLTQLERHVEALAALRQIPETQRVTPDVLYLLSINHAAIQDPESAHRFARLLATHHPDHALNQHLKTYLDAP